MTPTRCVQNLELPSFRTPQTKTHGFCETESEQRFFPSWSETTLPDPTDVKALRAAPDALVDRALRRWLRTTSDVGGGHPPSDAELSRVKAVVRGEAVAAELSGGRRVARTQGVLRLEVHGSGTVSS